MKRMIIAALCLILVFGIAAKASKDNAKETTTTTTTTNVERSSILYDRTTLHAGYDPEELKKEIIESILDAGFSAPTGGNQRSIEFFPVTERSKLDKIADIPGYFSGIHDAPLAIIIAGNSDNAHYPDLEEMDSGLAAMAMIVKATDLGLSSCVMSIYPQDKRVSGVRDVLNMTDNYTPVLLVAFGYPAADATTSASVKNYKESQVHYNGL